VDALDAMVVQHQVCLKVCELCGRLYCRAPQAGPYCVSCEVELREFPTQGSRKLRGRPARVRLGVNRPEFISKPLVGESE